MARIFTQALDAELIAALSQGETPLQFAERKGLNLSTVHGRVSQFRQTLARTAAFDPEQSRKGYQLGFADPDLQAAGVPQVPFAEELGDNCPEPSAPKSEAIQRVISAARQRLRQIDRQRLAACRGKSNKDWEADDGYSGVDAIEDHLTPARKLLARLRAQAEARAREPEQKPQPRRRKSLAC